jgi:hypothetical protein
MIDAARMNAPRSDLAQEPAAWPAVLKETQA